MLILFDNKPVLAVPFFFVLMKRSELTLQCTFHSLIRPSLIFYLIIKKKKKCIVTEFTSLFRTGVFVLYFDAFRFFFFTFLYNCSPSSPSLLLLLWFLDAVHEQLNCSTDWMYGQMYLLYHLLFCRQYGFCCQMIASFFVGFTVKASIL